MNLFFITMLMLLINNCNAKPKEAKNEIPYGLSKDGKTFFGKPVDATTLFFLAIAFPKYIPIGPQESSAIIVSELENPYWLALVNLLYKEKYNRSVTESIVSNNKTHNMMEAKFLKLFGRPEANTYLVDNNYNFDLYPHFEHLLSKKIKVYNEHIIDKNMYSNAITRTYYKYFIINQNNTVSYLCFKENAHGQKDYLIAKFKDEEDEENTFTYEEKQLPNSGNIKDWEDFNWQTIFSTDNVKNLKADAIHFNAAIKMFKHQNASNPINDEDKAKEIKKNYEKISRILNSLDARIAGQPKIADFFTQLKTTINDLEKNLQDNNINDFISHLEKAKIINSWFVHHLNPQVNFERQNIKYMELKNETILNMLYNNIENNEELYPELKVENNKFSIGYLASYNNENGTFIPYYDNNSFTKFTKLFKQNYDQNNNSVFLTEIKYTKQSEQKADSPGLNNVEEETKKTLFAKIRQLGDYKNTQAMSKLLYKKCSEKESIDNINIIIDAMLKPATKSKMASKLLIAQEMIELMQMEQFALDTLLKLQTKHSSLPYFMSQKSAAVGAQPTLCIALVQVFFLDTGYHNLDSSLLLVLQNGKIAGKIVDDQFIENSIEDEKNNQEHYDNLKDSNLKEDLSEYKKLKSSYAMQEKQIDLLRKNNQYRYNSQEATRASNLFDQLETTKKTLLQKVREQKLNQFKRENALLKKSMTTSQNFLNANTFDPRDEHKMQWLNEEIPKLEKLVTPSTI